jgi:integrase
MGTVLPFGSTQKRITHADVNRTKLTEQRIASLRAGTAQPQYTYDTVAPGLAVRVTNAGVRTFVVVKKMYGKTRRITLGRFPGLRLDAARQAASAIAGELAQGKDPVALRKALRVRKTKLEDVWPQYLIHLKNRNRTWARDEERWRKHVGPCLGRKALNEISRADCQSLVDRIGRKHKIAANRIAAFLSALLNFAIRSDNLALNLAKNLGRFEENARSRILKSNELPLLLDAIRAEGEPWSDIFLMLLFTGARRGSIAKMRWRDIDIGSAIWTLPAEIAKNKTTTSMPLTEPAIEILKQRQRMHAGEPWVFPSVKGAGPVVGLPKAWSRIRNRAGILDLRIHDIRRSVGTALARGGASPHIIATGLGHRNIASAKAYVRLAGEDARQALGDAIATLTSGTCK